MKSSWKIFDHRYLLLIWWFSKDESGMKQFLQHQCKVWVELFSCLADQEKHPASCHLDTFGWYSYWLKFTFTQPSSHTESLSHTSRRFLFRHQRSGGLLLLLLLLLLPISVSFLCVATEDVWWNYYFRSWFYLTKMYCRKCHSSFPIHKKIITFMLL